MRRSRFSAIKRFDSRDLSEMVVKPLKKVGDVIILKKVGIGAAGKVYVGYDTVNNVYRAIKRINYKEMKRQSGGLSSLEREIRMLQTFDHPNILKLYQVYVGTELPYIYLVLDYAACGSLATDKKYEEGDVLSIIKQVSTALNYIHDHGIVHQDIKPSNILLRKTGSVIIADFGIGHRFQSAAMVIGTPAYQAPEVLCDDDYEEEEENSNNESPVKEDVWALGITFYQLLFGKLPYVGENLYEILNNIRTTELSIPDNCNAEIAALIRKMLAVNPHERITMEDVSKERIIESAADIVHNLPEINEPPVEKRQIKELKVTKVDSFEDIHSIVQDFNDAPTLLGSNPNLSNLCFN